MTVETTGDLATAAERRLRYLRNNRAQPDHQYWCDHLDKKREANLLADAMTMELDATPVTPEGNGTSLRNGAMDVEKELAEVELEVVCTYCHGKGRWQEDGNGRDRVCGMCDGAGYIPTEFGVRVLQLVRHNRTVLAERDNHSG